MNTIDLFAGVGGIRKGMEMAGFKTVFSNDFDKWCAQTFDLNYYKPQLTLKSIDDIDPDEIPEFDVLTGGFPCQPFSVAGKRKGFEDPRGNHFFTIASLIRARQPTAFLLENVKGLLKHDKGDTFNTILETLYSLKYNIYWKVLNTKTHANIPQNRERLFILGFRDNVDFKWPKPIPLTKTYEDFLEDEARPKDIIHEGKIYDELMEFGIKEGWSYQWRYNYVRQHMSKGCIPCLVTVAKPPIIKRGDVIRFLTPKECFNLQGFPDGFQLPMISDNHLLKQVGNSVTVPLIKRIADGIRICTS